MSIQSHVCISTQYMGENESCAQVMNNCPYLSGIINACKAWITEDQLFSPAGKCG